MAELAIDPVCKMEVEPESAAASSEHQGITYYFCAVGCKKAFDEDPGKYLAAPPNDAKPGTVAAGVSESEPEKKPWWKFW